MQKICRNSFSLNLTTILVRTLFNNKIYLHTNNSRMNAGIRKDYILWFAVVLSAHLGQVFSTQEVDAKIKVQNINASNIPGRVSWIRQMKQLRNAIKQCEQVTKNSTWYCFKQQSLEMFSDIMSATTVPLWTGICFVRIANETANYTTDADFINFETERKDFQYLTWFDRLAMILARTLKTHKLQINLKEITDAYMRSTLHKHKLTTTNSTYNFGNDLVDEGRMRRHRYNMLITMMFGATALGAILVPMGFQLLSIVSGKALLMSKMALLLASINGLKRVANSGVHYGLYHVPGEHLAGYYDRDDAHVHHPRNVAIAQPLDISYRRK